MKILVLGATGMAGHTIASYMKSRKFDVTEVTQQTLDIYDDIAALKKMLLSSDFDAVINCVGILNQDAEKHKHRAVFLNGYLPHYLCSVTKDSKTKVIHMSTDCVFSGKAGNYHENSLRDGETFYDRSKALGEIDNDKDLTFRNSIIGPDLMESGIGLFNWFMKQNGAIKGYSRAIWTGVTTLTLAKAMEKALEENLCGLYHLVNNTKISKYELLRLFNSYFRDGMIGIAEDASVKVNKSLMNNRQDFSFHVPSYEAMVQEMKEWIYQHRELYPHYFR